MSQIETHVRSLHEMSQWDANLDGAANLSRMLALRAVHLTLGPDGGNSRIVEITDGTDDRRIAIGVEPSAKLVVFVQSKWRQDGAGSMALRDVLKLLQGVKSLLGMRTDYEPAHALESMRSARTRALRSGSS